MILVLLIFLINLFIVGSAIYRYNNLTKGMHSRRDLIYKNNIVNNESKEEFNKLYDKISKEIEGSNVDNLKKEKIELYKSETKKSRTALYAFLAVLFITFILIMQIDDILLRTSIFRLVFFIALAGLSIILGMNVKKQGELYKKFNKEYKLTYIKALLQNFESNIDYFPEQGISSEEYKQIGYEKYDNFKSDDYMKGVLKNGCKIELADVLTHKVSQDSSSKSMLLFTGIFSVIESPKEFNEILYIVQDSVAINQNNIKVEKIDLDSQEFEKNFNVYGTNKIVAMQLLTADIMQMLTEFKLQNGLRYEIAIKNSKIYMRFFSGPMFEAVKTGSEQQFKEELYRTYEILKFICEISYKMIDLIKSVEY